MKALTPARLLAFVLLAACGSSDATDSSSAQAGSLDGLRAVCQAESDYAIRCGELATGGAAASVDRCVAGSGSPSAYRADILQLTATCYQNEQQCTDPEACIDRSVDALNPQWSQDRVYKACVAKAADCESAGTSDFNEEDCTSTVVTTDATRALLETCFKGSCADLEDCCNAATGKP